MTCLSASRWDQAGRLCGQQNQLKSQLSKFMNSFPKSGLYKDEGRGGRVEGENNTSTTNNNVTPEYQDQFADFVGYVQTFLAQSPRTVLRRAVNKALWDMMFGSDASCSTSCAMKELCNLLGVTPNMDTAASLDIKVLVEKKRGFPRGRAYKRWSAAQSAADKKSRWESDLEGMRSRVGEGLRAKASREGRPPPSKEDVDAIVNDSVEKDKKHRQNLLQSARRLRLELETDEEHMRHTRVCELWEQCGLQQLWEDYVKADRSEGHERRLRGRRFEENGAPICFAMIARILYHGKKNRQHPQQHKQRHECPTGEVSLDDFWYVRGAHWSDDRDMPVGEIDLVVMHNDKVAALCEMKSSCFEIACAFQQHQGKLTRAAESDGTEERKALKIVTRGTGGAPGTVLSVAARNIPIFVATVLPSDRRTLGVEPALSQAVCDGIRNQGCTIKDGSTEIHATGTSLPTLLGRGLSRRSADQRAEATVPTAPNNQTKLDLGGAAIRTVVEDRSIDLGMLEANVRGRVWLGESPAGCADRCGSRLLVLREEDLCGEPPCEHNTSPDKHAQNL